MFSSSKPTTGKDFFLLRFLDHIIHQEVPKLKLPSPQELNELLDKMKAQQLNVQQFESTGFQDPQAAAETPSN